MTWRRMLVLVSNLPPESALNTAIRNNVPEGELLPGDPAKGKWSSAETLLATLIDEVRAYRADFAQVNSKNTVRRPKPIARPGLGRKPGKVLDVEKLKELDPRLRGLSDEEALETYRRLTGRG